MKRKIALKRLSASDLTFFEVHFRTTAGTKQKAFNLDRSVLIDRFYPSLPDLGEERFPLSLRIFGPGIRPVHELQRKILKQQKNWRLDGELIYNPPDDEHRYDALSPDDFALFDFLGDATPTAAQIYLVSQNEATDSSLLAALRKEYSGSLSKHKSMLELDLANLASLLQLIEIEDGHPIVDVIDEDAVEDAVFSGIEGIRTIQARRGGRGLSREEFAKTRRAAEKSGRLGEELLAAHFDRLLVENEILEFEWTSDSNAIAPYDFEIHQNKKEIKFVEVKSTRGPFANRIHISFAELLEMASRGDSYDLYRMYEVTETSAKLRIAGQLGGFAKEIVSTLSGLPDRVTIDGISLDPTILSFGIEEIVEIDVE